MNEMNRWLFSCVVLPLVVCAVYGVALSLVPEEQMNDFNGEGGPVENISALVFLIIGIVSAFMVGRLRRLEPRMPKIWFVWFALFAVGGILMAGEEVSWGQHFAGWQSPEFFTENSKQQETNLHNLYDDLPSRLMRRVMEIGLPITAIIMPALAMGLGRSYEPTRWRYFILPRSELFVWTGLAVLVRPVRKLGEHYDFLPRGSLSEFQELLWAAALLLYVCVMWARFAGRDPHGMTGRGTKQESSAASPALRA